MRLFRLSLATAIVLLAACQTTRPPRQTWPYPEPPVVEPGRAPTAPVTPAPAPGTPVPGGEAAPSDPQVEPIPPSRPIPNYPRRAEEVSSAAVTALVRQARQQRAAGQPAQAAASLERALRIEQRNPFVLSYLAQTYLVQKNYLQAEKLAQKSSVVARGNVWVELENWKTIAAARRGRGDYGGADQAQAQADALDQWLNAPAAQP